MTFSANLSHILFHDTSESMQKATTERDHMTIQMGTLQTLKMEKENLHRNYELLLGI